MLAQGGCGSVMHIGTNPVAMAFRSFYVSSSNPSLLPVSLWLPIEVCLQVRKTLTKAYGVRRTSVSSTSSFSPVFSPTEVFSHATVVIGSNQLSHVA